MRTDVSRDLETGYERFFGFSEAPFSLAPNTRFLFESASHGSALAQITYALERREPLVVVTGEIGTGKTLLCRTVVERLERRTFLSIINDPLLERDDLLKQMLQDFGVISRDRTKLTSTSRHDLVHALQQFLLSLVPLQAHAVLIIDEAQHIQPDVLEQIRLVSNIHDEHGTLLQIILVGQTDLEALLSRPELRQLKQRVSRHVRLEPLNATEVAQYIDHRLTVGRERHTRSQTSGANALEHAIAESIGREGQEGMTRGVTLTFDAIIAVSRLSRGLPRVVNLLCDRALEAAYAQQVRTVDGSLIETAARALDLPGAPEPVLAERPEKNEDVAPAAFGAPTPPGVSPRARRGFMLAASVPVVAAAIWFGGRTIKSPASAEAPARATTPPEANPSTARSVLPPSSEHVASTPAPARQSAPASPTTAGSTITAAKPGAESFEIVVASFHTEGRAVAVAGDITALGLPVRQRMAGGWRQVLAGPFTSRGLAEEAQERVDRAGFSGTQIVPAAR